MLLLLYISVANLGCCIVHAAKAAKSDCNDVRPVSQNVRFGCTLLFDSLLIDTRVSYKTISWAKVV